MKPTVIVAIMAAAVLVAAGCIVVMTNNGDRNECDVAVTMGWEKEMVDTISGGALNTVALMDPNTSPHASYSSTGTIQYLYNADLYIMIGSGVEWEESMVLNLGSTLTTDTISCMDMLEEHETHEHEADEEESENDGHSHSSHIWVSPEHLGMIAEGITEALKERYPQMSAALDSGLADYLSELGTLEEAVEDMIRNISAGQTIFVWHNAWEPFMGYLNEIANEVYGTDAYGHENPFLNVVSAEDAGAGDSPTVGTIQFLYEHSVNDTIYVSPFDAGSQYKTFFESNGYIVKTVNATAAAFLDEMGAFISYLDDTLEEAE
ncbi:MAG: metal ABC transporter substrate-binding protein [Candidatus Methanomethylophilaceae archaeon]|jgi:zinc transport system substrate-binding protein|nr:metal ABC transporter substrate-binding protein [Candidatus Methanomethylophilaceae archaeon]NLF34042.1 zinc ABC transporter substrate-binding protein [Thermoplasmatales archaeon]